ncbi:MAG: hypothetical protein P4N41_14240 [Negativicutes bacterium]|nr:hypothetical protein [Negativicutes bacterium]
MSAFIGPIHYWLYGKIRLVSEREEYMYQKAQEMCGSTAEELREQVWQTYGPPLADKDLSEMIDQNNIHGWLQRQINAAESREAAFIKELLDTCGDAAGDLVEKAFSEHGKITGQRAAAQGKYDVSTAPGIYKALNDHYLNGMPCDQADTVIASEAGGIVWETGACLQAPNWKRAGIADSIMAKFYLAWLKAFVEGINPAFVFRAAAGGAPAGTAGQRREIGKKK